MAPGSTPVRRRRNASSQSSQSQRPRGEGGAALTVEDYARELGRTKQQLNSNFVSQKMSSEKNAFANFPKLAQSILLNFRMTTINRV